MCSVNSRNKMNIANLTNSLIKAIKKHKSILIFIKGSPDPDAIGSSFAFQAICSSLGVKSEIIALMELSLNQNKMIVSSLSIPVQFRQNLPDIDKYDAYAVLDHPSNYVREVGQLVCAVHLDHHAKSDDSVDAEFSFTEESINSLSSLIALIYREMNLNIDREYMRRIATSLYYGILTDTDMLSHATSIDSDALEYISAFSDIKLIESLVALPYSGETMTIIQKAIRSNIVYKNWIIAGVGYIDEENRDAIAITADYLLNNNDFSTSVVFAIIRKKDGSKFIDASLRTKLIMLDLNHFIHEITPNGGARKYKGAYQVDLDYFSKYADEEFLWNFVRSVTVSHIKHGRDTIKYLAVTDIFSRIGNRFSRIKSIFHQKDINQ